MKYRHKLVTGHRRPDGTFGYLVKVGNTQDFYPRAWMAQARAEGWTPPYPPTVVDETEARS